jgi:hypothetical protein
VLARTTRSPDQPNQHTAHPVIPGVNREIAAETLFSPIIGKSSGEEGNHSGAVSFGLPHDVVLPRFVREQKLIDLKGLVRGLAIRNELRLEVAECE